MQGLVLSVYLGEGLVLFSALRFTFFCFPDLLLPLCSEFPRTAIGDARSPGEGGREHNREGGEAARGAPGSAKRVLALGYPLLVLSQSSTTTTTNSYSFRNADLPCIRWDYIYIFCLSGFLVFVFAKIAKF